MQNLPTLKDFFTPFLQSILVSKADLFKFTRFQLLLIFLWCCLSIVFSVIQFVPQSNTWEL